MKKHFLDYYEFIWIRGNLSMKKNYPIMYQCSNDEIRKILDNALGEQYCRRCNKKVDHLQTKYAGMRDKGYCLKCWNICYGREK